MNLCESFLYKCVDIIHMSSIITAKFISEWPVCILRPDFLTVCFNRFSESIKVFVITVVIMSREKCRLSVRK